MSKRSDAIVDLLREMNNQRTTKSGYRRALKACDALGLDEDERWDILYYMEYVDADRTPYAWLTQKTK